MTLAAGVAQLDAARCEVASTAVDDSAPSPGADLDAGDRAGIDKRARSLSARAVVVSVRGVCPPATLLRGLVA